LIFKRKCLKFKKIYSGSRTNLLKHWANNNKNV